MKQLEPKPGIYIQIKRKREFLPTIKICKLLQKENPGYIGILLWWDIIELRVENSLKIEQLTGKILEDYLISGCRIARINSIFRFKIDVEYANAKSN